MDDRVSCDSCGTQLGATAKFCSECGTPVNATRSAEYKQVTVLFADVVHSMDLAAAVGPERLREIMAELVNSASSVVQHYGGTVDKFTGDGIMAVFGAPVALEDHAIRACRAALGIQQQADVVAAGVKQHDGVDLRLRVGLNSGQVITGDIGSGALGYTAIGEHVGMAQRMESAAPAGGVMLSASTARLVEGAAILDEPEPVQIKGAAGPVPASRLLGMAQHRASQRSEANLVGRRWEMSAVEGLLERAIDGRGAVVRVVGPPGIGKSRLTRELASFARHRGVDVFTAFCESHTSQVPFLVIARLLRAATGVEGLDPQDARARVRGGAFDADSEDVLLFDDLLGIADPAAPLPKVDPDARRRRLTALVNAASLATRTPAVYVVEDAHWIDEASESMLADFLAVVPQTPLLTLITYRPEYHGALAQVPGAQTIALAPLSDSETMELVSELVGPDPSVAELSQTIIDRASGTPFFAEEIVRELAERGVLQGKPGSYVSTADAGAVTVPATLQATIAARIDRLDPKAKRTLNAAAVVGSRFSTELLTALGVEPEVAELVAAQLIDQVAFARDPEYAFHHPLIRAVAYEAQLKSDRADLHRRVAAAIQEQNPESLDENAALIAEHLEAAADLRAAYEWHMRAGTWANNRDVTAAQISWDRARLVADSLTGDDPDGIAMRIASRMVLLATGWRVHAKDVGALFDELRELCALVGDKTSLAIGMMGPMAECVQRGEVREASRLAAEQMALLESIGDPAVTVQASYGAMGLKAQTGDMDEILQWADKTIEWTAGDPAKGNLIVGSPRAVALALRGFGRSWFGRRGWREDFEDALAVAENAEPMTLASVVSWRSGVGTINGLLRADDTVIDEIENALAAIEASGDDYAVDMVKFVLGCALLIRGAARDRQPGCELLAHVRTMCTLGNFPLSELPTMNLYLGREQARNGDFDDGIRLVRKSLHEMLARGQTTYCVPSTSFLVETLLERGEDGDVAEAETAMATLAALPAEGSVLRDVWLLRMRALLARTRGDETAYRDLRDRYRDMATSLGFEGHMQWSAAMP